LAKEKPSLKEGETFKEGKEEGKDN